MVFLVSQLLVFSLHFVESTSPPFYGWVKYVFMLLFINNTGHIVDAIGKNQINVDQLRMNGYI